MGEFNLNKIDIYYKGLQNEVWIDDKAFYDTNLNNHVSYRVFKPNRVSNKVKKRPKLFKLLFFLATNFWFPINFFIQTKIFIGVLLKFKFFYSTRFKNKKVLIVATRRALDQIEKIKNQKLIPDDFLFFGTCKDIEHPKNKGIYHHLNLIDLLKAYFFSVFLYKKLKIKGIDKMHTIFSQDWLHSYIILNKSEYLEEIWFANHFDRWALLFNHYNCKKKVLIQHGILNEFTNPPNLIDKINYAYLIHKNQKDLFTKSVIKNNFNFETLNPNLVLTNLANSEKLNVLIIGNIGLYIDYEYALISKLEKSEVNLFLKPHPVLTNENYLKWKEKYSFTLIEDSTFFPKVDLVVSYESTLGLEYSQLKIDVLYYKKYSVENIISIINSKSY